MIVSSMNNSELVKEILLDIVSVKRKANYLSGECRRRAVKSKDKSFYHLFEYKSNRQNNWLIEIKYFKGQPTHKSIVYYLNEHGMNALTIGADPRFYWFTPHFLKRYNERFLKQGNISKLDLLKRFILVNKAGVADYNENDQSILCRFTEGIGLGNLEIVNNQIYLFHLRTFISDQMAFDEQQHFIEKAHEYYDVYCEYLKKRTGLKSL